MSYNGFPVREVHFFDDGKIVANLTRAAEYARLLASIRINAVVVNNVNANYTTLEPDNIEGLGRIADVFRPYGVQLGMSLYFASPANLTDLPTYDPLDSRVIAFAIGLQRGAQLKEAEAVIETESPL